MKLLKRRNTNLGSKKMGNKFKFVACGNCGYTATGYDKVFCPHCGRVMYKGEGDIEEFRRKQTKFFNC